MEFQYLAGEVLVEPLAAIAAGDRIRSDRARIVEVDEHPRMAFHCHQHVREAARQMRPDRLAFIGAGDGAQPGLVGRDAEVIGPEPRQPLGKADLGAQRGIEPGLGFLEKNLLGHSAARIGSRGACTLLHRRTGTVRHLGVCGRIGRGRGIRAPPSPVRGRLGGVLVGTGDEAGRLALLAKFERCACGWRTGEEIRIVQAPSAGPREIGNESAPWIGGDRSQRSLARA